MLRAVSCVADRLDLVLIKDAMGLTSCLSALCHVVGLSSGHLNNLESALLAVTVTSSRFGVRGVTCDGHALAFGL